jgi:deazaflavin-dependent oxidoreductase (nitroreductase family)
VGTDVPVSVPPRGTRGVPFPKLPGWLTKRMSGLQLGAFRRRRGGHTSGGLPAFILETVGARSGEPRHAMVGYLDDGPDAWLVVASLAGAARNPAWLYNLAKRPEAIVELGDGRRIEVTAETLEGEALQAAWRRFETEGPEYARYRSKTDRELPVIRLRRR